MHHISQGTNQLTRYCLGITYGDAVLYPLVEAMPLLPGGIKPLPESMLIHQQWGPGGREISLEISP